MTVDTGIAGRLIGVLRSATGTSGLEYNRLPEPMLGGFWAELFAFLLANPPAGWPAELVARLMPDPGSARKETILQGAVAAAGFPTPFVRAASGPDGGLGLAFMIMDRASGGPLRGELEQVRDVAVTEAGLLSALARFATEFGRPDLVSAARWLTDHPPAPARTSSVTVTCIRSTCSPTVTG